MAKKAGKKKVNLSEIARKAALKIWKTSRASERVGATGKKAKKTREAKAMLRDLKAYAAAKPQKGKQAKKSHSVRSKR